MRELIMAALGGGIGAVLRYTAVVVLNGIVPRPYIPFSTLAVNAAGSFCLGLLLSSIGPNDFLTVGVLGAFTTFSTFSVEAAQLIKGRYFMRSAVYTIITLVLSILLFYAGMQL